MSAALLPLLAGGATPRSTITLAVVAEAPIVGGDAIDLTARAKPLPRGYRIVIDEHAQGRRTWTVVEECARAVCTTNWTEADATTLTFRARVVHRKLVTRGPITVVAATSKLATVTWAEPPPPPPPPPPAPAAKAGRYCGFNDQGKSVCFSVTDDTKNVTAFATQSIVTCGDGSRWIWTLGFGSRVPIKADLTFAYSYDGTLTSSSTSLTNLHATYSINGSFDTEGNAKGTLALTAMSWDENGKHYDCNSAPYAWSTRLGA
jgi:hypothetical protein